MSPLQWYLGMTDRPIADMLAAMVLHNLFGRHPSLRIMSIENGFAWLPPLLRDLDHAAVMGRAGRWLGGHFSDHPSDILRDRLFVSPYPEEDPLELIEILGADHVLFGSDWPHAEGLARPTAFAAKLVHEPDDVVRRVMRDNVAHLLGVTP
jgi:predicted TIM-barrel fold metal-dependent hydrolase